MARYRDMGFERAILSPPVGVCWEGWRSDTRTLAGNGWEFAVERDAFDERFHVTMRHRRDGWFGIGQGIRAHLQRAVYEPYSTTADAIVVHRMAQENHLLVTLMGELKFDRVDMTPNYMATREEVAAAKLGIFRPWADKAQELIVEPETVSMLMDRIINMQSKDLAAIRERNRTREYQEQGNQEQVVAQIITLSR